MAGFNADASSCTIQNLLGTGTGDCDLTSLDDIVGGALTTKDVKFEIANDPFLSKYKEYVRRKKIFPMTSIYNFEQNTPDNEMATSSIGIKFEIREGKVEMSFIFNKSHCYHASLFSKKAFKKWNLILFFKNHVNGAKSIDGNYWKGFDMGMFTVGTFKVQQAGDPQMTKVTFQLTELGTKEWNLRMAPISNEEIQEELNGFDGVIETKMTYFTAPTATATCVIDVKSACNGTPREGLGGSTGWVIGGVQAVAKTIANVVESTTIPGRYTVTFSAALVSGDSVQPRFGTTGVLAEYAKEDVLGALYAGQVATVTTIT